MLQWRGRWRRCPGGSSAYPASTGSSLLCDVRPRRVRRGSRRGPHGAEDRNQSGFVGFKKANGSQPLQFSEVTAAYSRSSEGCLVTPRTRTDLPWGRVHETDALDVSRQTLTGVTTVLEPRSRPSMKAEPGAKMVPRGVTKERSLSGSGALRRSSATFDAAAQASLSFRPTVWGVSGGMPSARTTL